MNNINIDNNISSVANDMYKFNCWEYLYDHPRKDLDLVINNFKKCLEDIYIGKIIARKERDSSRYLWVKYLKISSIEMIFKDYEPNYKIGIGKDKDWERINRPFARLIGKKLVVQYFQPNVEDTISSYSRESDTYLEFIPEKILKEDYEDRFITLDEYYKLVDEDFISKLKNL